MWPTWIQSWNINQSSDFCTPTANFLSILIILKISLCPGVFIEVIKWYTWDLSIPKIIRYWEKKKKSVISTTRSVDLGELFYLDGFVYLTNADFSMQGGGTSRADVTVICAPIFLSLSSTLRASCLILLLLTVGYLLSPACSLWHYPVLTSLCSFGNYFLVPRCMILVLL